MKKPLSTTLLSFILTWSMLAQHYPFLNPQGGDEYQGMANTDNCLTPEQRENIIEMLEENKRKLKLGTFPNMDEVVSFDWPLRKATGLDFNSYYAINNFVDQNPATGVLDYHCDGRTYDGHRGIDIDTWPFPWYLYDNDYVEVVAAAAGVILGKSDGYQDDHCSCIGDWNAVYIQHSDGSVAFYGHMKKNSLTPKIVGQTVQKGEYLGVVASSGCSTQPHLHLEVYKTGNYTFDNLIDPYAGACNELNLESWWASQPPNREPTLNAILTHDAEPEHGCPGINEDPHFSNVFTPGSTIYMAAYYHDQLAGDVSTFRIKNPSNNTVQAWSHTSPDTYTRSWWYWTWILPATGPFGTWKVEIDYHGQTFAHEFEYVLTSSVSEQKLEGVFISPNPSNETIRINGIEEVSTVKIFNNYGSVVFKDTLGDSGELNISSLQPGVYMVWLETPKGYAIEKLVKI